MTCERFHQWARAGDIRPSVGDPCDCGATKWSEGDTFAALRAEVQRLQGELERSEYWKNLYNLHAKAVEARLVGVEAARAALVETNFHGWCKCPDCGQSHRTNVTRASTKAEARMTAPDDPVFCRLCGVEIVNVDGHELRPSGVASWRHMQCPRVAALAARPSWHEANAQAFDDLRADGGLPEAPRPSGAGAPLDADYAVKLREIAGEIEELTSQGGSVVYAVWGSVLREAADILARPALPATGTALEFEELKRAYDDLSAAYHELLEFHTSGEGAIVMLNGKPVAATGTGAWPTCATCRHYTAGFRGGFCHNWGSRDVPATGFCHEHAPSEPPAPTTARG